MLYERWEAIAKARGDSIAFQESGSPRVCTFQMLARRMDRAKNGSNPVEFPQLKPGNAETGLAEFLETILRAWREGRPICPLDPGQPRPALTEIPHGIGHLKITSATTGAARFVAFTPEQLAADADNIVATMGLRADWPNLGVISLAHSYGFSNLVLPLLLHGIPLILTPSPLPEAVRHAAGLASDITLPAVPAMWRAWHEAGAVPDRVRLAISAGAPLPLPVEHEIFNRSGLKIHNFYGATECGGIAYDAGVKPRDDASCTGAPMRNVLLSTNAAGCLVVRGKAVGECYWPAPNGSLARHRYVTSDLAEIRDGIVHLRGRAGDLINVAGRKVSPESIEQELLRHPSVKECLVLGVPAADAGRSDQIVACVVADSAVTADDLKHFLLETLPAWQLPRDWHFVDSLAPTQRGKLSRGQWRVRLGFPSR
ncbi:MAG: long-chain acyl-CoA synthetase [Verrucomicrobiota bacterium]|jgi:acyl-coenzyme A synthetase/AMP-(fatty) acid ligase